MGSLWRSEPLDLVQIFLPEELVHSVVHSLGEQELVQFVDVSCDTTSAVVFCFLFRVIFTLSFVCSHSRKKNG